MLARASLVIGRHLVGCGKIRRVREAIVIVLAFAIGIAVNIAISSRTWWHFEKRGLNPGLHAGCVGHIAMFAVIVLIVLLFL